MKKTFRDEFKHFKGKFVSPDFHRVIDFNEINKSEFVYKTKIWCVTFCSQNNLIWFIIQKNLDDVKLVKCLKSDADWERNFGMKNPSEWEVYCFLRKPGLFFVKNPFCAFGQRYWIMRCLEYFTKKPNILNIDAHDIIKTNEDWWDYCHRTTNKNGAKALEKLRWVTFGYHHNWDTKMYSESSKCDFPSDLKALCGFIAQEMNFSNFHAEAAIINMYHFGCTLSGHTDHSEVNKKAPLFSFSFGQSAIFLIGGKCIEDEAVPILLESGDIIIMAEESRLCYHGVPRILPARKLPWRSDLEKCNRNYYSEYYFKEVLDKIWDSQIWEPFEDYLKKSRINMNVRQVLLPGQKTLDT